MCGFVGLVDKDNENGKHSIFMDYAMHDLHRRGPDSQLKWKSSDGYLEFGFARLAIRDLSEAGNQPMHSATERYTIVYNGETYNTDELSTWANIDNQLLKGHSDTEIILACIEKKGIKDTLQQMDGIFAIALYDAIDNKLYLIRDHAGVKPLYMGFNAYGIVFSSHYQHITSHPFFKEEAINKDALTGYFMYGFIQEGEGLLENTYFLPHAHITTIQLDDMTWSWDSYFALQYDSLREIPNESLLEKYKQIVQSQLVSDVPIGCFLSGGVDSTLTTGIASSLVSNITAYTIGVDDKQLDESSEAIRFANYFNVYHELKQLNTTDILQVVDQYTDSMCEPLADYSSLMTLKVCELAKQKLTVVLSGDGGDELFWGYPRFQHAYKNSAILKLPKVLRFMRILWSKIMGKDLSFELMNYNSFDVYYLAKQGLPGNQHWVKKLLNYKQTGSMPFMYNNMVSKTISNELDRAKQLEYDIHMQRVLLKVDRASMYHSLEVRTPLLSKKMVELSALYSFKDCMNQHEGKLPLRKALNDILPIGENNSGNKKGFSPPMASWMRNELKSTIEKTIFIIPEILKPTINIEYIKVLWTEHQENDIDNSWPIWAIYSLFEWVNKKMFEHAY
jgi:asparagine synthase (glutamine-hydrolysing)